MNGRGSTVLRQIFLIVLLIPAIIGYKRVCYYTNWSQYRPEPGKFLPEDIDPTLCTHLIYAFSSLTGDQITTYEWNDADLYQRVMKLRNVNPNLKIMLAVGGWNAGGQRFSSLVSSVTRMESFADSALQFLNQHGFDGLDLDWEYPADPERDGIPQDKDRFTQWAQIIRERFNTNAGKRLLLTAALSGSGTRAASSYNLPELAKYLDFINLMAYDFHGTWENMIGHHTPLFPETAAGVQYYKSHGMPAEKIMLGMAAYGRSFTLQDPSNTKPGAPNAGGGTAGAYTREPGILSYYEVCRKLNQGYTKVWDSTLQAPYAYSGNQWVGYEDTRTIALKASYVKQQGLGGAMIWALDDDDFNNQCGGGKYPLLNALKQNLPDDGVVNPVTTIPTQPRTTAAPITVATTTQSPVNNFQPACTIQYVKCATSVPSGSILPEKNDATMFWVCFGMPNWKCTCPGGSFYNPCYRRCDTFINWWNCKKRIGF